MSAPPVTRRDMLRFLGIAAASTVVGVVAGNILHPEGPRPPESNIQRRLKLAKESVAAYPSGFANLADGAMIIQWGTADKEGNAVFPVVFPESVTSTMAAQGSLDVPVFAFSQTSLKTAPGAQWVAYGY